MQDAHDRWGTLPWAELLMPASELADTGFPVSPRLAGLVENDQERLGRFETTANYFLPDGMPVQVGQTLVNPEYADTLRRMATDGASAFYTGDIATDIVATVQNAPGNPGVLSNLDLSIYSVKERAPVCASFRAP